jgi:ABC-type antimicrobial peptide transport system permease subunit
VEIAPLAKRVSQSTMREQQVAFLLAVAGLAGLLLASIGVYGIMAQSVAQQTRSFGIRMALGACGRDIRMLVLRRGMRLMVIGVVIGSVLSLAAAQSLHGMLFGVSPMDPASFLFMSLIIAAVVAVASWSPARRAARLEPLAAMRD